MRYRHRFLAATASIALAATAAGASEPASDDALLRETIIPRLVRKLDSPEARSAAQTLGLLGPLARPALPAILDHLDNPPPDPDVRRALLEAAVAAGGEPAVLLPRLTRYLHDPVVRGTARILLFDLGPAAAPAVPEIVATLPQDAYGALGHAGRLGPAGRPLLPFLYAQWKKAMSQENQDLKERHAFIAAQGLESILGIAPADPRALAALSETMAHGTAHARCLIAYKLADDPATSPEMLRIMAANPPIDDKDEKGCPSAAQEKLRKRGFPIASSRLPGPAKPGLVEGLRFYLTTPKRSYAVGEPVPVTLHFEYSGTHKVFVDDARYDRGGRMSHLAFQVRDSHGASVPDPLPFFHPGIGGGLSSDAEISKKPFEQTEDVNQWALLDRPGDYSISASPCMVHLDSFREAPCMPLESAPLAINIAPNSFWSVLRTCWKARAQMKSEDPKERERAARLLRFLLDRRAIPGMIGALDDPVGNVRIEARLGLAGFPERAAVQEELRKALDRGYPKRADTIPMYADLLAQAETGITDKNMSERLTAYYQSAERWLLVIRERFAQAFKRRPHTPAETIEAISAEILGVDDPGACETALDNIGRMDSDFQFFNAQAIRRCNGDARLIPRLKKLAHSGNTLNPFVRNSAYEDLGDIGDQVVVNDVMNDLSSAAPAFDENKYRIAMKVSSATVVEMLTKLIESSDYQRAGRGARVAGDLGLPLDPARVEGIARHFPYNTDHETDRPMAAVLASLISKRDPKRAARIFGKTLCQKDRATTPFQLMDVMRMPASYAGPIVRSCLRSALPQSVSAAAEAIWQGRLSSENIRESRSYVPELIRAFEKTGATPEIRLSTTRALSVLTGIPQTIPPNPSPSDQAQWAKAWRSWLRKNAAGTRS